MYIAILGRQPAIGLAELESVYGSENVAVIDGDAALVKTEEFDIGRLGGTKKAGKVLVEFDTNGTKDDLRVIFDSLLSHIGALEGKVTLGLSSYARDFTARDLQQIGVKLKGQAKKRGGSLRLIPNDKQELNTATSHHNRLGLAPNKIEALIARYGKKTIVALSVGGQNISAYADRDQNRPARDMFVGMLPPKLAQIIINLAVGRSDSRVVLDPFCGTGVLLQEALLMGYDVMGTDLSDKMVEYSKTNIDWLLAKRRVAVLPRHHKILLAEGDATKYKWAKFDTVASETYLGQPFSAPPSPQKLVQVQQTCKQIAGGFLSNLAAQTKRGTRICIAVPAWKRPDGSYSRLNMLDSLSHLGYNLVEFKHARQSDLLYHRDSQVVGRELLVLIRS